MWFWMKQQTKVPVNGPARARWISVNHCRWLPSLCLHVISRLWKISALPRLKVLSGPQAQPAGDKAEFIEKSSSCAVSGQNRFLRSGLLSTACGVWRIQLGSELRRNREDFPCWLHHPCAQFLQKITDAYAENPQIANLLLAPCTSSKSPMTTSRRCAMSSLTQYRTVSWFRPSPLRLPIMTATVPLFCLRTWSELAWLFRCAYL